MTKLAVSVLLSRSPHGKEVLMVRRSEKVPFMGGYLAFPGGTLEKDDEQVAHRYLQSSGPTDSWGTFVAAAARELLEETGVWMARGPQPSGQKKEDYRRQLLDGTLSFSEILRREGQQLDGRDFVPLMRITTPPFAPTRYDTWFLHCHLPAEERIDIWPGELEDGEFSTAEGALEDWRQGRVSIVPPCILLLERLEGHDCESFLPLARKLSATFDQGRLGRLYFSCGVLTIPLETPTKAPATHTNAYLVGNEHFYLVDPASPHPTEQAKLWDLMDGLEASGKHFRGILLTHHHPDHVGALAAAQKRYQLPVFAHRLTAEYLPEVPFARYLKDGQALDLGNSPDGRSGWQLRVHHLPGHAPGHLAFQESRYRALLVGDLISTLSSILIDHRDGHLATYIQSLEFLESIADGTIHPGHGLPRRDGRRIVRRALQHRRVREAQLLSSLSPEPQGLESLTRQVYRNVSGQSLVLAERSLASGLVKLMEEGRAEEIAGGYRLCSSD